MPDFDDELQRWQKVASELKQARLRKDLSMRRVAKLAGMTDGHYRQMESGRRRVQGVDFPPTVSRRALASVAEVLGLNAGRLFKLLEWPPDESPGEARARGGRPLPAQELEMLRGELDAVADHLDELTRRVRALGRNGERAPGSGARP